MKQLNLDTVKELAEIEDIPCWLHYDEEADILMMLFVGPVVETTVRYLDDCAAVLYDYRGDVVGFQIEALAFRVNETNKFVGRMEQARQNFRFLEEQHKLLELIEEHDLDPSEILRRQKLGRIARFFKAVKRLFVGEEWFDDSAAGDAANDG